MNFHKRRTCGTEFLFEKPAPQKMVKLNTEGYFYENKTLPQGHE